MRESEVKNTLLYVVKILTELMQNKGEIVRVEKPLAFDADKIDLTEVAISSKPLQIDSFVRMINKQVDKRKMKGLTPAVVRNWLLCEGYISKKMEQTVKRVSRYYVTDLSSGMGILQEEKINKRTGEIEPVVVINEEMQQFILKNLSRIVNFKSREEDEGDDEIE